MGSNGSRETLVIRSDTRQLVQVRTFVLRIIEGLGVNKQDENKIVLAVDEAVTNIIEHGYDPGQDGSIEIEIEARPSELVVVLRDEGKFFNPELAPMPNILDHLRTGKKKGLGIFLMRQIMDEVRYRFKDGLKNELTLIKRIR